MEERKSIQITRIVIFKQIWLKMRTGDLEILKIRIFHYEDCHISKTNILGKIMEIFSSVQKLPESATLKMQDLK